MEGWIVELVNSDAVLPGLYPMNATAIEVS
jgi:hypothetical protein